MNKSTRSPQAADDCSSPADPAWQGCARRINLQGVNPSWPVFVVAVLAACEAIEAGEFTLAVRSGDATNISATLNRGADVNELDPGGRSALFYAVLTRKQSLVDRLLKLGAKPEIEGQSESPLWAAATNGDLGIVDSLLKAGADPGGGKPGRTPVEAAIRSGRVAVLQALQRGQPNLKLPERLGPDPSLGFSPDPVIDALRARHPAMAAHLVQQGIGRGDAAQLALWLFEATAYQPEPPDALLKELLAVGANPFLPRRKPTAFIELEPLSAVELAARMGREAWFKRFTLNFKPDDRRTGIRRLHHLARLGGAAGIIGQIESDYGPFKPIEPIRGQSVLAAPLDGPDVDPATDWDTAESAKLLPPRTSRAPVTARAVAGTVAVIAGRDAANEATAIAVALSRIGGLKVVERDEVESVLAEQQLDPSNPGAGSGLLTVGDLLRAEFLVIVSKPGKGGRRPVRAEVVSVATGLVTNRRHFEADKFVPGEIAAGISSALAAAGRKAADHGLRAVTLLGVNAVAEMEGGNSLRSLVAAGLMSVIDSTPGCVALTRMQMAPLIAERTLGEQGALWQAAWAVGAGVSAPAKGRVQVRLRLRDLRRNTSHDATVEGPASEIAGLVVEAWRKVATAGGAGGVVAAAPAPGTAEASLLREEARYRLALGEPLTAAQLADGALFLGLGDPDLHLLRVDARLAALESPAHHASSGYEYWCHPPDFPLLPSLAGYLEAIELMTVSMDRVLAEVRRLDREWRKTGGNRPNVGLGRWFEQLLGFRAALPRHLLTDAERRDMDEFVRRFESWTRRLLAELGPDDVLVFSGSELVRPLRDCESKGLDWLYPLVCDVLLERIDAGLAAPLRPKRAPGNAVYDPQLGGEEVHSIADWLDALMLPDQRPVADSKALDSLCAKLKSRPAYGPRLALEARMRVAQDEERIELAAKVAEAKLAQLGWGRANPLDLVELDELARYAVIDRAKPSVLPDQGEELLPMLLGKAQAPSGELLRGLAGYRAWLIWRDRAWASEQELTDVVSRLAGTAASKETTPGTTELRARLSLAAKLGNIAPAKLASLMRSLPPDRSPTRADPGPRAGTGGGPKGKATTASGEARIENGEVVPAPWLAVTEMPGDADAFDVGHIVSDPGGDVLWWSGCFVKATRDPRHYPDKALAGLARIDLATGVVKVATAPRGWWRNDGRMLVQPYTSIVHVGDGRVVWHVSGDSVFEVDPESLKLEVLMENVGKVPDTKPVGNTGVISGKGFVFLSDDRMSRKGPQRCILLRAGGKVEALVETSRRPEASPLDMPTNELELVALAGDRIRVFANVSPAFRGKRPMRVDFSLDGNGEPDPNFDPMQVERESRLAWKQRYPFHPANGRWEIGDDAMASTLDEHGRILVKQGDRSVKVPVRLELGSGRWGTFLASDLDARGQQTGAGKEFSPDEFLASNHVRTVVVGERGDDLLLMASWGISTPTCFSRLWSVPKELVRQAAK